MTNPKQIRATGEKDCTCGFLPSGGSDWNPTCPVHAAPAASEESSAGGPARGIMEHMNDVTQLRAKIDSLEAALVEAKEELQTMAIKLGSYTLPPHIEAELNSLRTARADLAEAKAEIADLEERERSHAVNYTIASQRGNRFADENEKLEADLARVTKERDAWHGIATGIGIEKLNAAHEANDALTERCATLESALRNIVDNCRLLYLDSMDFDDGSMEEARAALNSQNLM